MEIKNISIPLQGCAIEISNSFKKRLSSTPSGCNISWETLFWLDSCSTCWWKENMPWQLWHFAILVWIFRLFAGTFAEQDGQLILCTVSISTVKSLRLSFSLNLYSSKGSLDMELIMLFKIQVKLTDKADSLSQYTQFKSRFALQYKTYNINYPW